LLDDELIEMLKETLPDDLQVVFISAVTGQGLEELKDILWKELNSESNKIAGVIADDTLVHRDKDLSYLAAEVYGEDRDADEEIYGGGYDVEDDDEEWDDIEDADDIEYIDIEDVEDLEDAEEQKED
jgi:GTP-binding protein